MSRARRNASSPVQLFPFLAVLVSTIGSLVLLLLAINRQATLQAVAKSVAELMQQTSSEEESLARRRDELEREVAVFRSQLGAVESSERSVEQQLLQTDSRLRSEAERALTAKKQLDRIQLTRLQMDEQIQAICKKIEALQVAKARFSAEQQNADRTFVPVVHPGTNGTVRRPIYIECTAESVILQPEKIVLPPKALEPDGTGENPLARAVRTLGGYYAAHDTANGQPADNTDSQPYPLLLVRPSGISAYYAVREALEDLGLPFGYELIERDWLLSYPEPDPRARALALAALRLRPRPTGTGGLGSEPAGLITGNPQPLRRGGTASAHQNELSSGGTPGESAVAGEDTIPSTSLYNHGLSAETPVPVDNRRGGDGRVVLNEGPGEDMPVPHNVQNSEEPPQRDWQPAAQSPASSELPAVTRPLAGSDQKPSEDQEAARPPGRPSGTRRAVGPVSGSEGEVSGLALPGNPAIGGKIPIPRKVRIECTADRLVVGSKEVVIPMPQTPSLDEVVWQLREEMEREAATWGAPGLTFRWEPQLLCLVHCDALDTFYRLRLALAGSAIAIDHVIVAQDALDWNETQFLKSEALSIRSRSSLGIHRSSFIAHRFLE